MRLTTALRLNASPKVAFVGAGGKTGGIFLLGSQLLEGPHAPYSVLISTTTHLGMFQASHADHHIMIKSNQDLIALNRNFPKGLVMVTAEPVEGEKERLNGISAKDMLNLAESRDIPLLIEADGARMLPLKAPAEHEPVIPEFVDTVVVVAGLSGLGKPLSHDWVHRPERFAEISGLGMGETISPQALVRVLTNPMGGLKNIPVNARRIVLLTQANTEELQSIAQGMVAQLLSKFHAVIIASFDLLSKQENDEGVEEKFLPPGVERKQRFEGVFSVHEPVAGVVLAAGAAQRFGQPKQLLLWEGQTLVKRVTQAALDAGLFPVYVVTGAVDHPIRDALQGMPVQIVHNPNWQEGQSTSLITGFSILPENVAACVFLLADQPRVTPHLVRALVEQHAHTLSPLVAPQVAGQRANPVLFDRATFNELSKLSGDQGGRALFSRFSAAWVPWNDAGLTLDIDTLEDYRRLLDG